MNDLLRINDLRVEFSLLGGQIEAVKGVYRFYQEGLSDLRFMRMLDVRVDDGELPLWAEVVCSERDKVVALLAERGIEAKPFHPTLDRSPQLDVAGIYPNAERVAAFGLTLPSGPDQGQGNLERTVAALHDIAGRIKTPIEEV